MTEEVDGVAERGHSKWRRRSRLLPVAALAAGLMVLYLLPSPNQCVLAVTPSGLELSSPVVIVSAVQVVGQRLQLGRGQWRMTLPPGIDILLEGEIDLSGQQWSTGARLTVDEDHNLVRQSFAQRTWNTTKLYAWKLKHPGKAESEVAFVRAETVGLRSGPDMGPTDRQELSFGTEVEILREQDSGWLYVRQPQTMARGWLHRAVMAGSLSELDSLKSAQRIPRLILLISVQEQDSMETKTLAGSLVVPRESVERGDLQPELQPRDCLLFEETGLHLLSQPVRMLGHAISDPRAGELYCLNESGELETLDWPASGDSVRVE